MISTKVFSILRVAAVAAVLPFASLTGYAGGGAAALGTPAEMLTARANSFGPMSYPGVKISNFGVVDGHIFRGEQPSGQDYTALANLGIKTIIDLREDAKGSARRDAEAAGLRYINIGIDGHGSPSDAQAAEFVKQVNDPANGVCYVHCAGGRHRTGSMIAIYRMTQDGWTIDQAYKEMLAYDFYTGGGHGGFKTFVEDYYQRMVSNPTSVPVAFHAPAPASVVDAAQAN